MLEMLDEIDWTSSRDAFGPAESVPALLVALTHPRAATREEALKRLWQSLCHGRATLTEASACAVPFLLELVCEPLVDDRGAILELLHAMATLARPQLCEEEPIDFDPHGEPSEAVARAATGEVLSGHYPAILALLSDGDADVRARAALLGAELAHHDVRRARELVSKLALNARNDPDPSTRVAYVAALESHRAHESLRSALDDRSFAVRLSAAFALLSVDSHARPCFDIVRSALELRAHSEARYGQASRYRPLSWIASVCRAGQHAARVLLPSLLPVLATSSADRVEQDLEPLLALFFAAGERRDPPSLEQSAIAATIARNSDYFGPNASAELALKKHAMPYRARALRAYAERGPAEHRHIVPGASAARSAVQVLTSLLEGRSPAHVDTLSIVGEASDELLELIARLPRLCQLAIKSSPVSGRGLSALGSLPALRALVLHDLTLDAAAASALARSAPLLYLTLADVDMDDAALALLGAAPALEFMSLVACAATGSGFAGFRASSVRTLCIEEGAPLAADALTAVTEMAGLCDLRVRRTPLHPRALEPLRAARNLDKLALKELAIADALALPRGLTALDLTRSQVSARGLEEIERCRALSRLDLTGVLLSQGHLVVIAACDQLRQLRLSGEYLEQLDMAGLCRSLPDLQIRIV